ncbi:sialoadhesin isoform X3 [Esox lucius]|uniref:sialoadhesin isoform X3 n=1 Tax=Esox lucius TaxID=8010 RepID=UPI0014773BF4|nr:sialoadhesin isoform X3 [Esox lucius]
MCVLDIMKSIQLPSLLLFHQVILSSALSTELLSMCLGKMLLLRCTVIFACLWRDTHATSPIPSIPVEDVRALAGFCAVIPCSFTPPKSTFPRHREVVDVRLRHWTRHFFPLWTTAFSTQDRSASPLGDTAKGDCSVLIKEVTLDDSRVYDLSLKGREEKDWGRGRSVNLIVSKSPDPPVISSTGPVTDGQVVSLNCSTSYSCPSKAPTLQWQWETGTPVNHSEYREALAPKPHDQSLNVWSSLTFTASHRIKSKVKCEAVYPGDKKSFVLMELHVSYKPVILPVSSSCVIEGLVVLCRCSVDSNPQSAVTWSVNESVPPYDYNTSVSLKNGTLTAQLRGHVHAPLRVVCFAINALGNDSQTLIHTEEGFFPWRVIRAVGISLVAFLFLLVLLFCCRRKRGKRRLTCRPSVHPEGMGIYQDRMPLYINCTEVTHIYTNGSYQLVYQNCTPCFVRTKQTRPIGRRGGERRGAERRGERGVERRGGEIPGGMADRELRDRQSPTTSDTNTETAIYLEIL